MESGSHSSNQQKCPIQNEDNVKVFVLTPAELSRIGLVTKVENGQAVLKPMKNEDSSNLSETLNKIISEKPAVKGIKEVKFSEIPHAVISQASAITSKFPAGSRFGNSASGLVTTSVTACTARSVTTATSNSSPANWNSSIRATSAGDKVLYHHHGPTKQASLKCQSQSVTDKTSSKFAPQFLARSSGTNSHKVEGLNRGQQAQPQSNRGTVQFAPHEPSVQDQPKRSSRRILSGFIKYWLTSLHDIGYIRCPLRACNYISLSYKDMCQHYVSCSGVRSTERHVCPVCHSRLNSEEAVKEHLLLSHVPSTKIACDVKSTRNVEEKKDVPRILVRKRGYSKVHKVSWSISLEQKGYVTCLFQNCNFIALSMEEMMKHYGICNGSGSSAHIPCPFCNGRVENLDKLERHINRSHTQELEGETEQESTENAQESGGTRKFIIETFEPKENYTVITSIDNYDEREILQQNKNTPTAAATEDGSNQMLQGESSRRLSENDEIVSVELCNEQSVEMVAVNDKTSAKVSRTVQNKSPVPVHLSASGTDVDRINLFMKQTPVRFSSDKSCMKSEMLKIYEKPKLTKQKLVHSSADTTDNMEISRSDKQKYFANHGSGPDSCNYSLSVNTPRGSIKNRMSVTAAKTGEGLKNTVGNESHNLQFPSYVQAKPESGSGDFGQSVPDYSGFANHLASKSCNLPDNITLSYDIPLCSGHEMLNLDDYNIRSEDDCCSVKLFSYSKLDEDRAVAYDIHHSEDFQMIQSEVHSVANPLSEVPREKIPSDKPRIKTYSKKSTSVASVNCDIPVKKNTCDQLHCDLNTAHQHTSDSNHVIGSTLNAKQISKGNYVQNNTQESYETCETDHTQNGAESSAQISQLVKQEGVDVNKTASYNCDGQKAELTCKISEISDSTESREICDTISSINKDFKQDGPISSCTQAVGSNKTETTVHFTDEDFQIIEIVQTSQCEKDESSVSKTNILNEISGIEDDNELMSELEVMGQDSVSSEHKKQKNCNDQSVRILASVNTEQQENTAVLITDSTGDLILGKELLDTTKCSEKLFKMECEETILKEVGSDFVTSTPSLVPGENNEKVYHGVIKIETIEDNNGISSGENLNSVLSGTSDLKTAVASADGPIISLGSEFATKEIESASHSEMFSSSKELMNLNLSLPYSNKSNLPENNNNSVHIMASKITLGDQKVKNFQNCDLVSVEANEKSTDTEISKEISCCKIISEKNADTDVKKKMSELAAAVLNASVSDATDSPSYFEDAVIECAVSERFFTSDSDFRNSDLDNSSVKDDNIDTKIDSAEDTHYDATEHGSIKIFHSSQSENVNCNENFDGLVQIPSDSDGKSEAFEICENIKTSDDCEKKLGLKHNQSDGKEKYTDVYDVEFLSAVNVQEEKITVTEKNSSIKMKDSEDAVAEQNETMSTSTVVPNLLAMGFQTDGTINSPNSVVMPRVKNSQVSIVSVDVKPEYGNTENYMVDKENKDLKESQVDCKSVGVDLSNKSFDCGPSKKRKYKENESSANGTDTKDKANLICGFRQPEASKSSCLEQTHGKSKKQNIDCNEMLLDTEKSTEAVKDFPPSKEDNVISLQRSEFLHLLTITNLDDEELKTVGISNSENEESDVQDHSMSNHIPETKPSNSVDCGPSKKMKYTESDSSYNETDETNLIYDGKQNLETSESSCIEQSDEESLKQNTECNEMLLDPEKETEVIQDFPSHKEDIVNNLDRNEEQHLLPNKNLENEELHKVRVSNSKIVNSQVNDCLMPNQIPVTQPKNSLYCGPSKKRKYTETESSAYGTDNKDKSNLIGNSKKTLVMSESSYIEQSIEKNPEQNTDCNEMLLDTHKPTEFVEDFASSREDAVKNLGRNEMQPLLPTKKLEDDLTTVGISNTKITNSQVDYIPESKPSNSIDCAPNKRRKFTESDSFPNGTDSKDKDNLICSREKNLEISESKYMEQSNEKSSKQNMECNEMLLNSEKTTEVVHPSSKEYRKNLDKNEDQHLLSNKNVEVKEIQTVGISNSEITEFQVDDHFMPKHIPVTQPNNSFNCGLRNKRKYTKAERSVNETGNKDKVNLVCDSKQELELAEDMSMEESDEKRPEQNTECNEMLAYAEKATTVMKDIPSSKEDIVKNLRRNEVQLSLPVKKSEDKELQTVRINTSEIADTQIDDIPISQPNKRKRCKRQSIVKGNIEKSVEVNTVKFTPLPGSSAESRDIGLILSDQSVNNISTITDSLQTVTTAVPTIKCNYNTRHKGTLHPILKLEECYGSNILVKGRGRGRGESARANGRGRGRGRGGRGNKTGMADNFLESGTPKKIDHEEQCRNNPSESAPVKKGIIQDSRKSAQPSFVDSGKESEKSLTCSPQIKDICQEISDTSAIRDNTGSIDSMKSAPCESVDSIANISTGSESANDSNSTSPLMTDADNSVSAEGNVTECKISDVDSSTIENQALHRTVPSNGTTELFDGDETLTDNIESDFQFSQALTKPVGCRGQRGGRRRGRGRGSSRVRGAGRGRGASQGRGDSIYKSTIPTDVDNGGGTNTGGSDDSSAVIDEVLIDAAATGESVDSEEIVNNSFESDCYTPQIMATASGRRGMRWHGGRRRRGRGVRGGRAGRGGRGGKQGRWGSIPEDEIGEDVEEVQVKCAKCGEEFTNKTFWAHNDIKHYGLSWIEGRAPIDLTDEKVVEKILYRIHREGRKNFICEKCGVSKKSVCGFISHLQFCDKSEEEREAMKLCCTHCGRYMIPSSLKVHLQLHKTEQQKVSKLTEMVDLDCKKFKRAAAEKAFNLMQEFIAGGDDEEPAVKKRCTGDPTDELYQEVGRKAVSQILITKWKTAIEKFGNAKCKNPGCNFETSSLDERATHYVDCPMIPKRGFVCKLCGHQCVEKKDILEHMKDHESSPAADDTESEGEQDDLFYERKGAFSKFEGVKTARFKLSNRMHFLAKEKSGSVLGDRLFIPSLRWAAKYYSENYSDYLFPSYHTSYEDWIGLDDLQASEYLPVNRESVMISQLTMRKKVIDPKKQNDNLHWKTYSLFEATIFEGVVTFFAGGPVWAMAWCTVPMKVFCCDSSAPCRQYLAVSCHRSMDEEYSVSKSYIGKGLIQIWCFESLENFRPAPVPYIALAIAHNYGAIWCMEWCPSGCYDTEMDPPQEKRLKRIGLLAAACSDGMVHIFSVCSPDEVKEKQNSRYPVFETKPVASLVLDDADNFKLCDSDWQCLRISWFKGKHHRIIAGSFTNGMVAMWDIDTSSKLLYKMDKKRKIIFPYNTFQAHFGAIAGIGINPHDHHYIMTASHDRLHKIWDIRDTTSPITTTFRGMATDGLWLFHWPSVVVAYDDVFSRGHTNATLTPPRSFGFNVYPLMAQNSVAWSISSGDWTNSLAQGTLAGELSVIFTHQLLVGVDTEKAMKNKRIMLSYIELVEMDDQVEKNKDVAYKTDLQQCDTQGAPVSPLFPKTDANVRSDNGRTISQVPEKDVTASVPVPYEDTLASKKANAYEQRAVNMDTGSASCGMAETDKAFEKNGDQLCDQKTFSVINVTLGKTKRLGDKTEHSSKVESTVSNVEQETVRDNLVNNSSSDVSIEMRAQIKNDNCSEDVSCNSSISANCESDIKCEDYETVTSSRVNSPVSFQGSEIEFERDKTASFQGSEIEFECRKTATSALFPRTYSDIKKKYGIVLCDFPADKFSEMPEESRLWMRQSDRMRSVPLEMYPVGSVNRVSWNPNFGSFFWLAGGYQCGIVRLTCVSGMRNTDLDRNVQRISDAYR